MNKMKISKLIDGKKLHRDMEARYQNLQYFINNEHPEAEHLYDKRFELKYWKEAIERGQYNYIYNLTDRIKELEKQLEKSEKERWKTAKNLHKSRKKLREIKEIIK
jgi:DNA repair ATPase RecN